MDKLIIEKLRGKLKDRCPEIIDIDRYIRSAVLVPLLVEVGDDWRVLFEVRASHLQSQPGEICFPGGRINFADASPKAAAIRETCEELGVSPAVLDIWGSLGMLVTPFQQVIYPFVGLLQQVEAVVPDSQEVEEVFTLSVQALLDTTPEYHEIPVRACPTEEFPFEKIPRGRDYSWRQGVLPEFFYELDGQIIWGLTARILHAFLELLRDQG